MMKGKLFYLLLVSFIGMYCGFGHVSIGFMLFLVLLVILYAFKGFKGKALPILFGVFFIYLLRASYEMELATHSNFNGEEKEFLFALSEVKIDGDKLSSYAKELTYKENVVINYYIQSKKEQLLLKDKLTPGMICAVKGELTKPLPATNGNAFSYQDYLKTKKIHWILNDVDINLSSCQKGNQTPLTLLKSLRQNGIEYLSTHFPKETAPLAAALIFGDRNEMDTDLLDAYQELGIIHLLAISGLNVSFLVGIIFYLGLRMGVTRERMINWLLVSLPIYMILTGASPSVNRACMMMFIILLLRKWRLEALNGLDLVCLAFLLYILWSPLIIFDVGFQLSFCVTFSIILSSTYILKSNSHPLIILIVLSFISQLAATPILLYHFFEVSIISLLANLIFVPLFSSVISPVVLILFLLHLLLHEIINPLITLLNEVVIVTNWLTKIIGKVSFSKLVLGRPNALQLSLYILGIIYFFVKWEKQKGVIATSKILAIPMLLFTIHGLTSHFSPQGEATFIDVGQGDSILIILPYHKGVYLIDTGGTIQYDTEDWKIRKKSYEVGRDVLVPFLKSKGITTIDKLLLTHGDMDHIGGVFSLLKEIKVKEIILPKVEERSDLENSILSNAVKKSIPIKVVQNGDQWEISGFQFNILSPSGKGGDLERNDSSIVLYTRLGGLSWLFTGDLEEAGEMELIKRYPNLAIDVLKVGHHGSHSSTSELLLESYQPAIAIISVGRKNRFSHPREEVLQRLKERQVMIFRTDLDGAVTYSFQKEKGTFSSILP